VPREVAEEIAPADHWRAGGPKFVIIGLEGQMPKLAPQSISLSIVYEPVEDGWVQARIEGIPEVITAGPTKAEARALVLDALREYLLSIRGNGDAVDRELLDLTVS
jgi:hypothetical protein